MQAINVNQPWAELILQGRKTIELRSWETSHRGLLAIRATDTAIKEACERYGLESTALTTGAILGTVRLVNVIEFDFESWRASRSQHLNPAYSPGNWLGWCLQDPNRLDTPLPCTGLRGMFTLPEEISNKIQIMDP